MGSPKHPSLRQFGNALSAFGPGYAVSSAERRSCDEDMQAQLEKLRVDAAECALIRDLAIDRKKRMFARLAEHLGKFASEVERAIAENKLPRSVLIFQPKV
jgi:hypothetical protein